MKNRRGAGNNPLRAYYSRVFLHNRNPKLGFVIILGYVAIAGKRCTYTQSMAEFSKNGSRWINTTRAWFHLEHLTKPFDEAPTDKRATKIKESLMDIVSPFIADSQSAVTTEPGKSSFSYPAVPSQSFARFYASTGDSSFNASFLERLTTLGKIIPFVGMEFVRSLPRSASRPMNWLDGIKYPLEHHRVVDVRSRDSRRQRNTLPFDHNVALRAGFAAIRRILAGFGASPGPLYWLNPARLVTNQSCPLRLGG